MLLATRRLAARLAPTGVAPHAALFARVVPNIKRLGLLSDRVRRGFEELEIIQFESVDPEAQDRALGIA